MNQYHSPYMGMGNNPVSVIDPTGGDDVVGYYMSKGYSMYEALFYAWNYVRSALMWCSYYYRQDGGDIVGCYGMFGEEQINTNAVGSGGGGSFGDILEFQLQMSMGKYNRYINRNKVGSAEMDGPLINNGVLGDNNSDLPDIKNSQELYSYLLNMKPGTTLYGKDFVKIKWWLAAITITRNLDGSFKLIISETYADETYDPKGYFNIEKVGWNDGTCEVIKLTTHNFGKISTQYVHNDAFRYYNTNHYTNIPYPYVWFSLPFFGDFKISDGKW